MWVAFSHLTSLLMHDSAVRSVITAALCGDLPAVLNKTNRLLAPNYNIIKKEDTVLSRLCCIWPTSNRLVQNEGNSAELFYQTLLTNLEYGTTHRKQANTVAGSTLNMRAMLYFQSCMLLHTHP